MRRPKWAKGFIERLRRAVIPNVSASAKAAGVSRQTVYNLRETDPTFAAEWDEAIEGFLDNLEAETARRAFKGTLKPVYYQGERCGAIREFSDSNAQFLLKSRRRAVYGDKVAVTNPDGSAFSITVHRVADEGRKK